MADVVAERSPGPPRPAWGVLGQLDVQAVLVWVAFGVLFMLACVPRVDVDLGWHLRTGQLIWETGTIPRSDPYSYTVNGQPWITHEWLSEAIMWPVYARWGHAGLMVMASSVLTAGLWLTYQQMREEAIPRVGATLALLLGAFAAMSIWGTRPTIVTLCLAPLFALILRRWWRGQDRWLVALPPVMALWVNLHGGYMFGLGLVAVYLVAGMASHWLPSEAPRGSLRALSLAAILTLAAALLNPNTYHILWYPFDTLTSEAMRKYLGDWPSPDFHQIRYVPFALMLGLFFVSAARTGRRIAAIDLLLVLSLAALGLQSNRHVPLFALVCTPILARLLRNLAEEMRDLLAGNSLASRLVAANRPLQPGLALVLVNWLVLLAALGGLAWQVKNSLEPTSIDAVHNSYFPAAAVRYIEEEGLSGRIYNAYNWGGYLVLQFHPQRAVFIDSRADVYRDAFIEEYLEAYYVRPGWRETLAKHQVDYALLERTSSAAVLFTASGEWREVYADEVAVLLARTTAGVGCVR
ncbi:MAG: hypothetical protein ACYC4L_07675 [Chloroflexota bacterium]